MNPIEKYDQLTGDILEPECSRLAFFKGSNKPDVLIVGEAPGLEENLKGKPFVGPSGNLIEQLIAECGLSGFKVAYLNAVFRMPVDETSSTKAFRKPTQVEIDFYKPMVQEVVNYLQPTVILACGNVACESIIGKQNITRIRGNWFSNVMPTFHPSYVLRNEEKLIFIRGDMKSVADRLRSANSASPFNDNKSERIRSDMNVDLALKAIGKRSSALGKELWSIKTNLSLNPSLAISTSRKALEFILEEQTSTNDEPLHSLISNLSDQLPDSLITQMHFIRKLGNTAAHSYETLDKNLAKQSYEMLLNVACWHYQIELDECESGSARYFIANALHRTWPKIAILTKDGRLYSEYLAWMKPKTFEKDGFDFSKFKSSDFSFGEEEHGNAYQSLHEVTYEEAACFKLNSQENWVDQYLDKLGVEKV